jgi:hypothetical protein
LGNIAKIPSQRQVVSVFWTHQGNVITVVYDRNGELKQIESNGEPG